VKAWVRTFAMPLGGAGAALIALLGAIWAETSALPARRARCDELRAQLMEVDQLAETAERYAPHLRALDEALGGAGQGRPLLELFAEAAPGVPSPAISANREIELDGRHAVVQSELALPEVPLDALSAFLQACATSRPPWRVSALRVQALDVGATRARALITLESPKRRAEGAGP